MFNNSTPFTMPVVPANGGYGTGGMFGDGGWLWAILIFALLGGWGGGFGFGGFGGGRDGGCATQADVRAAVDQQTLISKLDQQTYGLADSTYALNNTITNGFNGVQATLCQGFNGVDRAIADCCCTTQRAIDGINYNMATNACDIKHAINDSTRSILDFLTTDKIAALQSENASLKQNAFFNAALDARTAEIIRRTGNDCPVPAYVVPNPNCCYNPFGFGFGTGYGNAGGCGCGC